MNNDSSSKMTDKRSRVKNTRFADSISVLHVDDEEAFLKATKIYLEDMGEGKLKVDSLINPEHVFKTLQEKTYDAIVADYSMPSIDGLQLLKQLRNQNVTIPYIILTGRSREEVAIKALNLGANRYIKKGMDTESQFRELIHAIQEEVRHKRTQDALRESERRYRQLFESAPVGIGISDFEGRVLEANQKILEITGYTLDELKSISLIDTYIKPEDRQNLLKELRKKRQLRDFEVELKRKDGTKYYCQLDISITKLGNREVFLTIQRDLTKWREITRAKTQSEERLRAFMDSATESFYLLNSNLGIIDVNKTALQRMNLEKENVLGKNIVEFRPDIKEMGRVDKYLEVIKTGYPLIEEEIFTHPSFPSHPSYFSVRSFKVGEGLGIIGTDITERKQAEVKLRESEEAHKRFYESTKEMIFSTTLTGRILSVNPTVEDILGYTPDQMRGMNVKDFYTDQDLSKRKIALEELMEKGYLTNYEVSLVSKDGAVIHGLSNVVLFRDKETDELIIESYFRDITERKHAEVALKESEERLKAFIEAAPDNIQVFDSNLNYIAVNKAVEKELGLPKDEILGKHYLEVLPFFKGTERYNEYKEVIRTGKPFFLDGLKVVSRFGDKHFSVRAFKVGSGLGMIISDVTDRKRAEKALQESEEKYRLLVERANDGIGIVSDNKLVFLNQQLANMLEYTIDELLNKPYTIIIHPDVISEIKNRYQSRIAGKDVPSIYESKLVTKSGNSLVVELNVGLIDYQGDQTAALSFIRDISGRKKVEEALREIRERFRAFFYSTPDAIDIWDSDLNLIDCNQAVLNHFSAGIRKETLIGKNITEIIPDIKETGRYDKYIEVLKTGKPYYLESFISNPKFGDKIFSVQAVKVSDGLGMITRDITEYKQADNALRESEEKYRTLVETTKEGILTVDSNGLILHVNPAATTMLGYQSPEELISMPVAKVYANPKQREELFKEMKENSFVIDYEVVLKKKDGTPFHILASLTMQRDKEGNLLRTDGLFRDITERKRIEDALHESQEKYRSFLENFQGIAFKGFQDFSTDFFTGKVEEMTGYTENDFVSEKIIYHQLIHPEDLQRLNNNIEEFMASSRRVDQREYRILDKSGEVHWIHEYIQKSYDSRGGTTGVYGTLQDITDRKQAEEALRETKEKYQMLVEKLEEGVLLEDAEGKISFVNPKITNLLGYTESELLGKYWAYIVPPESLDKAKTESTKRRKGISSSYELHLQTKNKVLKPVIIASIPIFSVSNEFNGVLSVFTDITEQKQVERKLSETKARLEYLLTSNPAVIYACESKPPYGVIFISENVKEITGYDPQDFLVDPNFMDNRIHPEDRERTISALNEILKPGTYQAVYRFLHRNGSYRWMLEEARLILDEQGNTVDRIGSWTDITRQKQAEKDLLSINRELQDFASIVAHDLKAPLRNITNLAEWLLRDSVDKLSEEGKDNLNLVVKQIIHMNALIDGIHEYSKIDRIHKKIKDINLNELLSDIIKILSPAENIEITIQTELPILAVDRTHVIQIFSNLLDNAVKFIDKPKGYITIRCKEKKDYWRFSVADNGPGIEERYFERIFQIFQTLSTWDEAKGTGIGLAIVKKVVEMNGGIVWLESTLKEGTTFFFTLPKG